MIEKGSRTRMFLEHKFNGCRFNQSGFECNTWRIDIGIHARSPDDSEDDDSFMGNLTASFQKMNFFLSHIINDIFVVSSKNIDKFDALISMDVANPIIMLPENTTDDIFVQVLHKKLSVICGDSICIEELSLRCEEAKTTFKYSNNNNADYLLPDQKDFMGEDALYDEPWWSRYDCDTCDECVPEGIDKEEIIQQLSTRHFLDTIEQMVHEEDKEDTDQKAQVISMSEARKVWDPRQV
jgi:hypothetical protein